MKKTNQVRVQAPENSNDFINKFGVKSFGTGGLKVKVIREKKSKK